MTQLTGRDPNTVYGDFLTTTNNGQGLTTTLENLQDGFGNNSPVQIATNAINFNRTGGRSFQLDGTPITVPASTLNNLQANQVFFVSGTLSSAQIHSMYGSAIELIPASGVNSIIVVNQFLLQYIPGVADYDDGGPIYLQYSQNGSIRDIDNNASDSIDDRTLTGNPGRIALSLGKVGSTDGFMNFVDAINIPVCITNNTENFSGGDGNVNYYISYTIFSV